MLTSAPLPPRFSFGACPQPPGFALDWQAVASAHPWLADLAGVPQDKVHHAEGDVLVHTRRVTEALVGKDEWRRLPPVEREILFAAALLHDVGKPATTLVGKDGRVSSPHHAREGEGIARELLWQREVPAACREAITALVRLHGLPLWFIDQASASRALIRASWRIRLDRIALLSEADAEGRICGDAGDLRDRLTLFRELAAELGCLDQPRAFANGFTRVTFFRRHQQDPSEILADDTAGEVILLCGLPGAGKDTLIHQGVFSGHAHLSLDELRHELGVGPGDDQTRVLEAARRKARAHLRVRRPFVFNATNLTQQLRAPWIELFAHYHFRTRAIFLDLPRRELLRRNRERSARLPEKILDACAAKLEPPDGTEAHRVDWILAEG